MMLLQIYDRVESLKNMCGSKYMGYYYIWDSYFGIYGEMGIKI